MTITAQDVYDRLDKARHEQWDAARPLYHHCTDQLWNEWNRLLLVAQSWQRVADRVRAGDDVFLAVMSRETAIEDAVLCPVIK